VPAAVKCSSEEIEVSKINFAHILFSYIAELKEKLLTHQTFSPHQCFIDTKSALYVLLSFAPPNNEII
jgi:hypothetical protein